MEPITAATLAVKFAPIAIKAVKKVRERWDEHQIQKELEECLEDAGKAFWNHMPKDVAADPAILSKFLDTPVFQSQCERLLEGKHYDLNVLETEFRDSGYDPIPGFNPRLAISEYFDRFIQSAGRKENFVDVVIPLKQSRGFKGRYFKQLIYEYGKLNFGGVPDAYGHTEIKLEDIFVKLDASQSIPEVDVLLDDLIQREIMDDGRVVDIIRPLEGVRMRESTQTLSVTDALKDNGNMVVLGAPGSGKTTFMKYLALTFAQDLARKRLGLEEHKLPILVTLQDMARILPQGNIAEMLSKYVNDELQMDLPDGYFLPYLESGRCIILFDGLDEVASVKERGEVARKVALFANLYPENRCVITSRIAGYREIQQFSGGDFPHFTVKDFDDDQIKGFALNWYKVRKESNPQKSADDLVHAIEQNAGVKKLAANPLMLTIVAVVYRASAELPSERIILYDRCTNALLYSWQREQGRPRLKDTHGNLIPDQEVRLRLEGLAYWMHSESPAQHQQQTHVPYALLKAELAKQLIGRRKVDEDEADGEAEHFLEYIRKTTGVLLERGTELYAFVHLTFQEYFAAYDIYRGCRA